MGYCVESGGDLLWVSLVRSGGNLLWVVLWGVVLICYRVLCREWW